MKRSIAGLVSIAGALLLAPGVAAAAPPAQEPVTWTIPAGQCPNLPTGTSVTGTGTLRVVEGGRVTVETATGTAMDQAGNVYRWSYSFRAVKRSGGSELYVDHFVLAGAGPATLNSGLVAVVGPDGVDVIHEFGNPYDFENDLPICDPL